MSKQHTIKFSVHPTPKKPGDSQQTYHVRQQIHKVVHTAELKAHIEAHTNISEGLFELVVTTLRQEIVEQLLAGNGVHIDGLGLFTLQLGTVKDADDNGNPHGTTYTSEQALRTRDVIVSGVNFIPDKQMLGRLLSESCGFERVKRTTVTDIPRGKLLKTLADYCAAHGGFTRTDFQRLFHVTRYRADQMLTELVGEEFPKYYRTKQGAAWVYRKTGS